MVAGGEKAKGQVCLIMVYTIIIRDQKGRGSRVIVSAVGGSATRRSNVPTMEGGQPKSHLQVTK